MSSVIYKNEHFEDLERAIDITVGEPIDKLLVQGCTFTRCRRGIAGWYKGPRVRHAVIEGCVFETGVFGILLPNVFDFVAIRDCEFRDITRTAINVGSNELPLESYPNAEIVGNRITHVHADKLGIGIFSRGVEHTIARNGVQHVSIAETSPGQDDDAVGIYAKTSLSDIVDNYLVDAGGYEACLCLKGGGYGNRIAGNTIRMTKDPGPGRWNRAITVIESDDNHIGPNLIDLFLRVVISRNARENLVAGQFRVVHDPTCVSLWPE